MNAALSTDPRVQTAQHKRIRARVCSVFLDRNHRGSLFLLCVSFLTRGKRPRVLKVARDRSFNSLAIPSATGNTPMSEETQSVGTATLCARTNSRALVRTRNRFEHVQFCLRLTRFHSRLLLWHGEEYFSTINVTFTWVFGRLRIVPYVQFSYSIKNSCNLNTEKHAQRRERLQWEKILKYN